MASRSFSLGPRLAIQTSKRLLGSPRPRPRAARTRRPSLFSIGLETDFVLNIVIPAHDPDRAPGPFGRLLTQNQAHNHEQGHEWEMPGFSHLFGLKLLLAVPAATAHSRASA